MSWNVVLNKFVEIKGKALRANIGLWAYDQSKETCIEYWIRMLSDTEAHELISKLILNEYQDYLLIHYGSFADIFAGKDLSDIDKFWNQNDGFYKECRSVVIDIKNDCLALTPFRKFRNINEGEETSLENIKKRIDQAKCIEFSNKLDGSMQSARYYNGQVLMAGSQALNKNNSWRLADGYRMLMAKSGYQEMLMNYPDKTFIFEYISKKDAHVVHYDTEGLFLIGVRDVITGAESSYREVLEYANKYDLPTTELFNKTLDEIMSELDDKKSSEAEGFVANIDGFKVKIKYNDYVYMHRMLSAISSVNVIIKSIADGNFDDVLAKVPTAYKDRVLKVAGQVFDYKQKTIDRVNEAYSKAPKDDRKQFMLWIEENVPKDIRGYVRCEYLGKSFNVLMRGSQGYLKLGDMEIKTDQEEKDG